MPRVAAIKRAAVSKSSTTPRSSSAIAELPPAVQPPPPSPIVSRLRQDYRWAAISQFLWTFGEAFGLLGWDIEVSLCRRLVEERERILVGCELAVCWLQ
jgi:hypothetical protein